MMIFFLLFINNCKTYIFLHELNYFVENREKNIYLKWCFFLSTFKIYLTK